MKPELPPGYGGPEYDRLMGELCRRLQEIGMGGVAALPHLYYLERLVKHGVLLKPAGVRFRRGEFKACHRNVQRLARAGERRAYGLALCGPLWIEHSWLVSPDGYVIETTLRDKRVTYFGIVSRRPVRVSKAR